MEQNRNHLSRLEKNLMFLSAAESFNHTGTKGSGLGLSEHASQERVAEGPPRFISSRPAICIRDQGSTQLHEEFFDGHRGVLSQAPAV